MINIGSRLLTFTKPVVMGILNVTPDSFYGESRTMAADAIAQRAKSIIDEGAAIIDIGGCSTRPDSKPVDEDEEKRRLASALDIVRRDHPQAVLSIDTFRPAVAEWCVREYDADIINDVTGGTDEMYATVANLGVPYILTSQDSNIHDMLMTFATATDRLHALGQKDIILDPGFGFGKTREGEFAILNELDKLKIMDMPLLVGVSRKRMIYQTLGITPEDALNGTTAVNTIALTKGADILRVHDVKAAVEAIELTCKYRNAIITT